MSAQLIFALMIVGGAALLAVLLENVLPRIRPATPRGVSAALAGVPVLSFGVYMSFAGHSQEIYERWGLTDPLMREVVRESCLRKSSRSRGLPETTMKSGTTGSTKTNGSPTYA